MKRRNLSRYSAAAFAIALAFSVSGGVITSAEETEALAAEDAAEVQTITLTTYGQPFPYTYVDEDDSIVGYDIDVARAVFELLPQYELDVQLVDITGVLGSLDAGLAQISANQWNKTAEREEKYLFSEPILNNNYVALFQAGKGISEEAISFSELGGLSTVVKPGSNMATAEENYNEQNPDNPIVINYTDEDLSKTFVDVADGLYDFLLYNESSFVVANDAYGLDFDVVTLDETSSAEIMGGEPYEFFIIEQGQEELKAAVDGALAELAANGTLSELSEKYFYGNDYAPTAYYED